MLIKVKCIIFVNVEIPDDEDPEFTSFDIEENSCPGTGRVFLALRKMVESQLGGNVCLFCPEGKNEIVKKEGKGDKQEVKKPLCGLYGELMPEGEEMSQTEGLKAALRNAQSSYQELRLKIKQNEQWLVGECRRIGVEGKHDESNEAGPFILVNIRAEAAEAERDHYKKYANHKPNCESQHYWRKTAEGLSNRGSCTCGLEEPEKKP